VRTVSAKSGGGENRFQSGIPRVNWSGFPLLKDASVRNRDFLKDRIPLNVSTLQYCSKDFSKNVHEMD
jgi:hypothetical protein